MVKKNETEDKAIKVKDGEEMPARVFDRVELLPTKEFLGGDGFTEDRGGSWDGWFCVGEDKTPPGQWFEGIALTIVEYIADRQYRYAALFRITQGNPLMEVPDKTPWEGQPGDVIAVNLGPNASARLIKYCTGEDEYLVRIAHLGLEQSKSNPKNKYHVYRFAQKKTGEKRDTSGDRDFEGGGFAADKDKLSTACGNRPPARFKDGHTHCVLLRKEKRMANTVYEAGLRDGASLERKLITKLLRQASNAEENNPVFCKAYSQFANILEELGPSSFTVEGDVVNGRTPDFKAENGKIVSGGK